MLRLLSGLEPVQRACGVAAIAFLLVQAPARGEPDQDLAARQAKEGIAAYESGDYESALAAFRNAYDRFQDDPVLLYFMGCAAEKLGHSLAAISYYSLYLEEGPDPGNVKQVREALVRLRQSLLGTIEADCTPRGSALQMAGFEPRRCPCRVEGVSPGAHAVVVRAPGYQSWTGAVVVRSGQTASVSVELDRLDAPLGPQRPQPRVAVTPRDLRTAGVSDRRTAVDRVNVPSAAVERSHDDGRLATEAVRAVGGYGSSPGPVVSEAEGRSPAPATEAPPLSATGHRYWYAGSLAAVGAVAAFAFVACLGKANTLETQVAEIRAARYPSKEKAAEATRRGEEAHGDSRLYRGLAIASAGVAALSVGAAAYSLWPEAEEQGGPPLGISIGRRENVALAYTWRF